VILRWILIGGLWLVLFGGTARAQTLDGEGIRLVGTETAIFLGDSVVIDVQAAGLLEPLDTAPLFADADLLRETVGTRIAVIDGKVMEVHTRHMEFVPRREGTIRFGPLSGETGRGTVRSNTLNVLVEPLVVTDWQPGPDDYRMALTVSRTEPYIHALITIDLELRHRHPIVDERITLPDFDGLDTLTVYAARRTRLDARDAEDASDPGEQPWRRVRWRWLAWPTRSGAVDIPGAHWQGTMIRSRTARAAIDGGTESVRLEVAPAAMDAEDWWLPARNVRLDDAWSTDPTTLSAGDEIVRTLTLEADDVLASQLPVVRPLASRSLSSVPLGVTREQTLIDGRIRAKAEYRFRLTARSPVPVFLDTVRVPWWDTGRALASEAIVPARRVNIGLPDRADLLASSALDGGVLERWSLRLRSIGARLPTSDLLAGGLTLVLGAGICWTTIGPWARCARRVRSRRRATGRETPAKREPARWSSLPPP